MGDESTTHIHEAVKMESLFKVNYTVYRMPKRAENPFGMGHDLSMSVSSEISPDAASYFQSIIGNFRWMVELGRIDINTGLSLLSSHFALPREGHLEAAVHRMAYIGQT